MRWSARSVWPWPGRTPLQRISVRTTGGKWGRMPKRACTTAQTRARQQFPGCHHGLLACALRQPCATDGLAALATLPLDDLQGCLCRLFDMQVARTWSKFVLGKELAHGTAQLLFGAASVGKLTRGDAGVQVAARGGDGHGTHEFWGWSRLLVGCHGVAAVCGGQPVWSRWGTMPDAPRHWRRRGAHT